MIKCTFEMEGTKYTVETEEPGVMAEVIAAIMELERPIYVIK